MKKDNSGKISDQKQAELSNEINALKKQIEIEAALERVRAATMSMQKSEDLVEVATILYYQLLKLSVDQVTESSIVIFDQPNNQQVVWTGKKDVESLEMSTLPLVGDHILQVIFDAWDNQETFYTIKVGGKELENHQEFVLPKVLRTKEEERAIAEMPDPTIFNCAFFSKGYLELITSDEINEATESILCRFAKVFDQTYTRFLDLKKAELQAHEAQIEAALERVRSRSMGMHQSHELKEVIQTVYEQLVHLSINVEHAGFIMDYQASEEMNIWLADQQGVPSQVTIPYFDSSHWNSFIEAKKKGINFFANRLDYEEKNNFYKKLFKYIPSLPEETKQFYFDCKGLAISTVLLDNIGLYVENFSGIPYTDQENEIVMRFGRVFQQTYTRFLDLKKAEEQAREAQIEAALERVRARAMAMHKSEELAEAAELLYQQLRELGVDPWTCGYVFIEEENDVAKVWQTEPNGKFFWGLWSVPLREEEVLIDRYNSWRRREKIHRSILSGQDNIDHAIYIVKHTPLDPNEKKAFLSTLPADLVLTSAHFSQGYLLVITEQILADEQENLLTRFAKVFELTYQRFLDLKKAEEQAWEAQIEAALEKVRSRTMGMQRSEELQDAAMLLFQQIEVLDIPVFACGFNIWDPDKKAATAWMAGKDRLQPPFKTSSAKDIFKRIHKAAQKGESLFVEEQGGEALRVHYKYMNSIPEFKEIADKVAALGQSFPTFQVLHCAYFSHGYLMFISFEPVPQAHDIFKRFAKVFEQTYTRFLDLKKAEQQAREAQIEVALERVRARTMAMHKGDELAETAILLFEQITELGIKPRGCGFLIMNEATKSMEDWSANINEKGKATLVTGTLAFDQHPIISDVVATWRKGDPYFIGEIHGKELQKYYRAVTSKESTSKAIQDKVLSKYVSEWTNSFYFEYGMMYALTPYAISKEEIDVLLRFARVFKLTYRRFLDLKKAEEQAREAQIEASLERVRAASMAMHHSHELSNVAGLIIDQLGTLGLHIDSTMLHEFMDNSGDLHFWAAAVGADYTNAKRVHLPYFKHPFYNSFKKARKQGVPFLVSSINKSQKDRFFAHFYKYDLQVPKKRRAYITSKPGMCSSTAFGKYTAITVNNYSNIPYAEEENKIITRFSQVFEQSYTRFLDLKKAEEQAREAQIEAALERIRNRTLLMRDSGELNEAVAVFFQQFQTLGLLPDEARTYFCNIDPNTETAEVWMTRSDGTVMSGSHHTPLTKSASMEQYYQAWKQGQPIMERNYTEKALSDYLKFVSSLPHIKKDRDYQKLFRSPPKRIVMTDANFLQGNIGTMTFQPLSEEAIEVLKRFAKVFEFTYTRFLDLKKSEAQAREAQIEVALERIRARAMAMHNSEELMEVANVMREQMSFLGQPQLQTAAIHIYPEHGDEFESWLSLHPKSKSDKIINETVTFNKGETKLAREMLARFSSGEKEYTMHVRGKPFEEWRSMALKYNPVLIKYWGKDIPNQLYWHFTDFSGGSLVMVSQKPPTEETKALQRRVSATFDLAYRRFLDLEQAEEQAREAQIEAALERVRAAAMAMHSSDDVFSVAEVMHDQLGGLGKKEFESSIVHVYPEGMPDFDVWYCYRSTEGKPLQVTNRTKVPNNACSWTRKVIDLYRSDKTTYLIKSSGKMLRDWYRVMADEVAPDVIEYDRQGKIKVPKVLYYHFSKFSGGALLMTSGEPPSNQARDMQRRAAKVFDLAYRRFLDLKKAEEQAREAQIEAALERVRASTMAMHSSEDVGKATMVLFQELEKLGVETLRCGVAIIYKNKTMEVWTSSTSTGGEVFTVTAEIDMNIHPLFRQLYVAWKSGKEVFSYELTGKDAERYYSALGNLPDYEVPALNMLPERHISNCFLFKEGALFAFTKDYFKVEASEIFQKFTNVYTLTYSRYLDLKRAEAREQEAVKQASLDRVRAEIASMRSTEDLQHITPLIWRELRSLGVPFFRCGVFIIDEASETVHMYLSTPTGEPLAALHLDFEEKEIPLVQEAINHWKTQTVHRTHWKQQQFRTFTESLRKRGLIKNLKTYQQGEKPPESLYLHQVPFKQGMLYVGNSEPLPDDQVDLVHSLADAFSVAYARYEDFVQLEEAKKSVENTLTELKAAQNQLIHSEKMASLGELTAGIAHEIQNPLNFVNNFSEVSNELLNELKDEINSGNVGEVIELVEDLIQNLDKIAHHGKRASSIVKGMLDHSRASSDEKAPTDINQLADEYLRLAYHGFRAKDKSFNANFKAILAEDLQKINVVPQDIGRVILNLVNNAFQAVRGVENPEVVVATRCGAKGIEISVKDNGPGIPENIREKIFQPFFTTKAAGEGTGLGLSLSYDIITKGHGGTIEVNTEVGKGTEFLISL